MSEPNLVEIDVFHVISINFSRDYVYKYNWKTLDKTHVYIVVFNHHQRSLYLEFLKQAKDDLDFIHISEPARNRNYPNDNTWDRMGRNVVVVFEWKECHRTASATSPVQGAAAKEKTPEETTSPSTLTAANTVSLVNSMSSRKDFFQF